MLRCFVNLSCDNRCFSPATEQPVASSATEDGTLSCVFRACLSLSLFLPLRSSQANSDKKKAHVSDSASTASTAPPRNVAFSCSRENSMRSRLGEQRRGLKRGLTGENRVEGGSAWPRTRQLPAAVSRGSLWTYGHPAGQSGEFWLIGSAEERGGPRLPSGVGPDSFPDVSCVRLCVCGWH